MHQTSCQIHLSQIHDILIAPTIMQQIHNRYNESVTNNNYRNLKICMKDSRNNIQLYCNNNGIVRLINDKILHFILTILLHEAILSFKHYIFCRVLAM